MKIVENLLEFIAASPTPFHAVHRAKERLKKAGFQPWSEAEPAKFSKGGKYFVDRDGSALIAFKLGKKELADGVCIVGSHTDSPNLRVKSSPEYSTFQTYYQVGVEVYGSVLVGTWCDRDLSLAGRVAYADESGKLADALLDFQRPIAVVPNLAIHLNRDANEQKGYNKQLDLPPILGQCAGRPEDFRGLLAQELKKQGIGAGKIYDFDLHFYDVQPPRTVGLQNEFIASARLDNLISCFTGLEALIGSTSDFSTFLVCNDHEEIGSASRVGAQGNFLKSILERVAGDSETLARMATNSLFISADNSHGIHPNYPSKHEPNHAPLLNRGPAIKINANQRYATTGVTAAALALACDHAKVPYQKFMARTDMGCGSTIGPLTATATGIATVDIGVPTLAMHSIREMAGVKDIEYFYSSLVSAFAMPWR